MARKAKEATPDPLHNMTADQIAEKQKAILENAVLLEKEMDALKVQVKSISAKIGVNKKDFKKAGGEKSDYDWYLLARRREPEDIDNETRRRNRIAKFMNLPIGTQLGLLDDGDSVASAIEKSADKPKFEDDSGYQAAFDGKMAEDNPHEDGSPAFLRWHADFERGMVDCAKQRYGGKNKATVEA